MRYPAIPTDGLVLGLLERGFREQTFGAGVVHAALDKEQIGTNEARTGYQSVIRILRHLCAEGHIEVAYTRGRGQYYKLPA